MVPASASGLARAATAPAHLQGFYPFCFDYKGIAFSAFSRGREKRPLSPSIFGKLLRSSLPPLPAAAAVAGELRRWPAVAAPALRVMRRRCLGRAQLAAGATRPGRASRRRPATAPTANATHMGASTASRTPNIPRGKRDAERLPAVSPWELPPAAGRPLVPPLGRGPLTFGLAAWHR